MSEDNSLVQAVARAIQDAHAPGHPINHVSIYQARAAIAALQARSAEPVGEAKAIIDELNACYLYGVSEKSDKLAQRIIAHLSRSAEPAGEELVAWDDLGAERYVRDFIIHGEVSTRQLEPWEQAHQDAGHIDMAERRGYIHVGRDVPCTITVTDHGRRIAALLNRPATPTNPERLVADPLGVEEIDLDLMRKREVQMIGAALSTRNWHDMETAYNQLRDKVDRELGRRFRIAKASAAPLKEGE